MNMQERLKQKAVHWHLIIVMLALCIATALFLYGIQLSLTIRLKGDAAQYLNIAQNFNSFRDALFYTGNRTLGMPFFDYVMLRLNSGNSTVVLLNNISWVLFTLHQLSIAFLCWALYKAQLFAKRPIFYSVLFFLLAAYPAFIMYTTTPLSDVLSVDILLIVFSLFSWSEHSQFKHNMTFTTLGIISGLLLGSAILLRESYLIASAGFLISYAIMLFINHKTSQSPNTRTQVIMLTSSWLTVCCLITAVLLHGKTAFGAYALQTPMPDAWLTSWNDALVGVRTAWNLPASPLSIIRITPDPFMLKFFHSRCEISSVFGTTQESLLGCFMYNPFATLIFMVKKCIGFFDTFQMTPFTEFLTPVWYLWLSRTFASLAFVGFWVALYQGIRVGWNLIIHRQALSSILTATWVFCIILFMTHFIFHIEERYLFLCIPFAIIALLLKIQSLSTTQQKHHLRHTLTWSSMTAAFIILFITQTLELDSRTIALENMTTTYWRSFRNVNILLKGNYLSIQTITNQSLEYIQKNQLTKATRLLEHANILFEDNISFYNNLCFAYILQKQYSHAILACSTAIKIDPQFQLAKNNLAWAKQEQKDRLFFRS